MDSSFWAQTNKYVIAFGLVVVLFLIFGGGAMMGGMPASGSLP